MKHFVDGNGYTICSGIPVHSDSRTRFMHSVTCLDCLEQLKSQDRLKQIDNTFNESGSKYLRTIDCISNNKVDVYAVLDAFNVTCPARQHAIKKLLCSGLRGKASELQDITEARDAVNRAVQMQEIKEERLNVKCSD